MRAAVITIDPSTFPAMLSRGQCVRDSGKCAVLHAEGEESVGQTVPLGYEGRSATYLAEVKRKATFT